VIKALFLALFVFVAPAAHAEPPRTLRYEGTLRLLGEPAGFNGEVTLSYALYAEAEGGDPLWQSEPAAQQIAGGRIQADLGPFDPVLFNGPRVYLAARIHEPDGAVELRPRQPVSGVAYALVAHQLAEPGIAVVAERLAGDEALREQLRGPQGEAGPAGSQGPQGIQGEPGPQGEVGALGPRGEVGSPGPQGQAGPPGDRGSDGLPGPMGPQGPQGERGLPGAAGVDGLPGSAGLACWDNDGNGALDPDEDLDGDGLASTDDCRVPGVCGCDASLGGLLTNVVTSQPSPSPSMPVVVDSVVDIRFAVVEAGIAEGARVVMSIDPAVPELQVSLVTPAEREIILLPPTNVARPAISLDIGPDSILPDGQRLAEAVGGEPVLGMWSVRVRDTFPANGNEALSVVRSASLSVTYDSETTVRVRGNLLVDGGLASGSPNHFIRMGTKTLLLRENVGFTANGTAWRAVTPEMRLPNMQPVAPFAEGALSHVTFQFTNMCGACLGYCRVRYRDSPGGAWRTIGESINGNGDCHFGVSLFDTRAGEGRLLLEVRADADNRSVTVNRYQIDGIEFLRTWGQPLP
jgi:hypothetical protein